MLEEQKKLEEAIAAYRTGIKLDPNLSVAQENLKQAEHLLSLKSKA